MCMIPILYHSAEFVNNDSLLCKMTPASCLLRHLKLLFNPDQLLHVLKLIIVFQALWICQGPTGLDGLAAHNLLDRQLDLF